MTEGLKISDGLLRIQIHAAEQFFQAAKIMAIAMEEQDDGQFYIANPVCAAFSLELYLKCLIVIEGKDPPKCHDLLQLFNMLNPKNQDWIRSHFDKNSHDVGYMINSIHQRKGTTPPRVDLEFVLKASRSSFHHYRYFHEKLIGVGEGWLAANVLSATRDLVHELRPDWKEFKVY